jgi:surface polysaccharide O-acyltransferase-like enzyme
MNHPKLGRARGQGDVALLRRREFVRLKIAIPLVAWSLFYTAFLRRGGASISYTHWLTAPVIYHLGFLYPFLQIYLILPVIQREVAYLPKGFLWATIAALVAVGFLEPMPPGS